MTLSLPSSRPQTGRKTRIHTETGSMLHDAITRPFMPGVRALGALVLLSLAACGTSADGAPEPETEGFVRIVNVEVERLEPQPFLEQIRLTGAIQANRDVTLSAEESGRIVEIVVDKGREVRTGDVILRIDDTVLRSQVAEARAQASLASETWERRRRLWEDDQVGSELAYLEARFTAEQSAARLATLEERLARTQVRSPIDGVFDERRVELGALVSAGTPVARIVQIDPVKVVAGVPERYGTEVVPDMPAAVRFDVLDGQSFEGEVRYVGASVDPRTRTFPIEVEVPNPGGRIKPEMIATLSLARSELQGVIVVPQEALVRTAEGFRVFVAEGAEGDRIARAVDVEVGPGAGNEVVITAGLEAGDELVVVGQQQLAGGDRIRIVEGGQS